MKVKTRTKSKDCSTKHSRYRDSVFATESQKKSPGRHNKTRLHQEQQLVTVKPFSFSSLSILTGRGVVRFTSSERTKFIGNRFPLNVGGGQRARVRLTQCPLNIRWSGKLLFFFQRKRPRLNLVRRSDLNCDNASPPTPSLCITSHSSNSNRNVP